MQIFYGLLIVSALAGMYQLIYLLNLNLKKKLEDKREIKQDIQKFGTCCGRVDSCTLEAKLNEMRLAIKESFPESISEISSGGKTEKVD